MMRLAGVVALLLACTSTGAAQNSTARPPEVTDSAVLRGKQLYFGAAGCYRCHGPGASGDTLAPPLTGAIWFDGPGTYEWLVQHITTGVPAHKSMAGVAMPARGMSNMTDAQVRDVAAFVWLMTHGRE